MGGPQVPSDEGVDQGGVDANGDVASDPGFGPVVDGTKVQEVLEDSEAVLAKELDISSSEVMALLRRVFRKLGTREAKQALAEAKRLGLLDN